MYKCAHCRQPITDKVWRAYVPEKGTDIERVHHACETAYEAARDQRAARPQLLPASVKHNGLKTTGAPQAAPTLIR